MAQRSSRFAFPLVLAVVLLGVAARADVVVIQYTLTGTASLGPDVLPGPGSGTATLAFQGGTGSAITPGTVHLRSLVFFQSINGMIGPPTLPLAVSGSVGWSLVSSGAGSFASGAGGLGANGWTGSQTGALHCAGPLAGLCTVIGLASSVATPLTTPLSVFGVGTAFSGSGTSPSLGDRINLVLTGVGTQISLTLTGTEVGRTIMATPEPGSSWLLVLAGLLLARRRLRTWRD